MAEHNRDRLEMLVRRAVKRAMRPYRKADHNRQPPYAKIRKAIVKELEPLLNRISRNAGKALVKEFGGPDDKGWLPEPGKRAEQLADDLIQVSRARWADMAKPRTRAEVLNWRKQNLGDQRAITVSITEVTRAIQEGEDEAWAYLKTRGVMLDGIWRTRRDQCELCRPMKNKRSAYWRKFYPAGPPSPHPRCRCSIEHVKMIDDRLANRLIV